MKAVIDHFGANVRTKPVGENQFRATVKVCPSPTFYRWIFGWQGKMKIEGPEIIQKNYIEILSQEIQVYK
jgi:hypothetical protein